MSDKPIHFDSIHRVAFDLAVRIANDDIGVPAKSREYWLTLYQQCRRVVNGSTAAVVLREIAQEE